MGRILEDIAWSEPVLPMPEDPEWAAELTATLGAAAPCQMMAARSPWLRRALAHAVRTRIEPLSQQQMWVASLVTSQENACRYCYGSARGMLRMLGLDPSHIEAIERQVRVAGSDPKERGLVTFARKLSRSSPRPVRTDIAELERLGFSPEEIRQLAAVVVLSCFLNRFATFMAVPLVEDQPELSRPSVLGRAVAAVKRRLEPKFPLRIPPGPPPEPGGPFGALVDLLHGSEAARLLDESLRGAFESTVLPARTKALIFAVVARALECHMCETGSRSMLEAQGMPAVRIDKTIAALGDDDLDETENILLPWVRETVHYQTETIQRKTHELARRVDPDVLLEAVGVASLANACARLSMLEQ